MNAYIPEKKELAKFNKSLKGHFPALEKELDRLVNIEDDIGILVSTRKRSLEVIVSDFCERKNLRDPGGQNH